jgi:hypothetical protein
LVTHENGLPWVMSNTIKLIQSYPERMVRWLPIPFWISWLLFWSLIFLVDFYVLGGRQSDHHPLTEFGITMFCACICINLVLCSRIMGNLYHNLLLFIEDDHAAFEQWYQARLKWIYGGIFPLVAGVLFAAVVEITVGPLVNSFNQASDSILYFRAG